jgi:hypothetical protein
MTIYIIEKLIVKVRKKMLKSLKISLIAIDKTTDLVYNIAMTNKNTTQGNKTMTLARFMNYILYTDKKPDTISSRRWCSKKKSAENNFKKVQKKS